MEEAIRESLGMICGTSYVALLILLVVRVINRRQSLLTAILVLGYFAAVGVLLWLYVVVAAKEY
jgi:hypothetical protein